jgi:radical SAM superfamily enzyme YgiQ (UPF0313 family)
MRIALVQSYWRKQPPPVYPLGIACVATALNGRHSVRCFDETLLAAQGKNLVDELRAWNPEVAGLGMRNADGLSYQDQLLGNVLESFSPLLHLRDTARLLKEAFPGIVIIAGGAVFTIFARRVMEVAADLDFGIVGESESSFPELLENLSSPDRVPGVAFRREGSVILPAVPVHVDFGRLPALDRHVMDVRPYVESGVPWAIGIQSKRGCMLSCAYCVFPVINGGGVRLRKPADVVDEIESLVRDYGLLRFQFADSVFNQPQSHAVDICRLIIERGLKVEWSAWFDIFPLDEPFLRLAHGAGCRIFELSPDSFSDRTLTELQKHIRCRDIVRVCRLTRKVPGISISFNFLFGSPGETPGSAIRLLLFLLRLKLFYRKRISVGTVNLIRIMPGTPIFHRAVAEGLIPPDAELLPLDPTDMSCLYYRSRPGGVMEKMYHAVLRFGASRRKMVSRLKRHRHGLYSGLVSSESAPGRGET